MVAALGLAGFASYEVSEQPANQLFGQTLTQGPTNERVVIHGIDVDEFNGGRMTRATTYSNFSEFLAQVAPAKPAP